MTIFIDIDGTICTQPGRYEDAKPISKAIRLANKLYDAAGENDRIVYWTARGTTTGIDWRDLTEKQFKDWGVKYHELRFCKPQYDLFIDDKAMNGFGCPFCLSTGKIVYGSETETGRIERICQNCNGKK